MSTNPNPDTIHLSGSESPYTQEDMNSLSKSITQLESQIRFWKTSAPFLARMSKRVIQEQEALLVLLRYEYNENFLKERKPRRLPQPIPKRKHVTPRKWKLEDSSKKG
jgi:hypothetical protein